MKSRSPPVRNSSTSRANVNAGKDARPFCMVASLTHPHDPYAIPQKYWDMYRDEDIDMPASSRFARSRRSAFEAPALRLRNRSHAAHRPADPQRTPRVLRRDLLRRRPVRRDPRSARTSGARQGHDRHRDVRSRRDARRARPLVQDDVLRRRLPRAADRARAAAIRRASRGRIGLASRPAADAGRTGARRTPATHGPIRSMDEASCRICGTSAMRTTKPSANISAEGAIAPIVMLRRGRFKFIHTPADPDQLYDVTADPLERKNLATRTRIMHHRSLHFARKSRNAGISPRCTTKCCKASGAAIFISNVHDARHDRIMGLAAARGCEPALYAQSHRSRYARSDGALSRRRPLILTLLRSIHPHQQEADIMKKLFKQAVIGVALLCAAATFASAAEPQSLHAGQHGGAGLDRHRRHQCNDRRAC